MRAGEYSEFYAWSVRSLATADGYSEKPDAYTASGNLWGTPAEDTTSGTETQSESEQQVTTATIRLRNYPTVKPLDRLTDSLGRVWRINHHYRGANETVCDVRIDT